MIETAILKIFRICTARPALTLTVYLLLTLGAVLFTSENFAIHTDTSQLISSRLPWRQRELQLDAAFPQQVDTLLVVVDGATPELADDGASRLAAALAVTMSISRRCMRRRADLSSSITACCFSRPRRCSIRPSSSFALSLFSARLPPIPPCGGSPKRFLTSQRGRGRASSTPKISRRRSRGSRVPSMRSLPATPRPSPGAS